MLSRLPKIETENSRMERLSMAGAYITGDP